MGWAATTTMISGPEAAVASCWARVQEKHTSEEVSMGLCEDWDASLAEPVLNEAGAQKLQETGPHCGFSDPLLEELSATPLVGSLLGIRADGGEPNITAPADARIKLLSCDHCEGIYHWWMARASDLLGQAAAPQSQLPSAADGGRHELESRLHRELSQALKVVTPQGLAAATHLDSTEGMSFSHGGPHMRRAEKRALPLRQALDSALRALQLSDGTELAAAVRSARTHLRAWDMAEEDVEDRHRRRDHDLGGACGIDDIDDPEDDENCYSAENGYGGGGMGICFQFRDRGHCSWGARCRYRHSRYPGACGRKCLECRLVSTLALKLCSVHLGEVGEALQQWLQLRSGEQRRGVSGFLERAAALGHWVLINHDNEGC